MRRCDAFFEALEKVRLAVTYGEVRLKTGYSETMPSRVSLETRFSRRVPLKIPIVSAAMDTVTESRLAIALAKLGGLGVIHKNLDPEAQREEVRRVKFHLSGLIAKPITVRDDMTMARIQAMREEKGFSFHSFPVIDAQERLVGIITENDFDFCTDFTQKSSHVMTRELVTAPPDTSIDAAWRIMLEAKKKVLPLMNPDGSLAGMYLFTDLKRIKSSADMNNIDSEGRLRVGAAVGVGEEAFHRVALLVGWADVIVIDTAHGDHRDVLGTLKRIKDAHDIDVVVGNISQGGSAKRLADAGADGIKVGQGPGSICTTRIVAGVGCPQVTATYYAAKETADMDVPICADGGIEYSGDIPIAIAAGADCVMMGRILAGTTEAPGEPDFSFNPPRKYYRGMGSRSAMESSRGSRERYLQEDVSPGKLVPEGVPSLIPFLGPLKTVVEKYLGGLRAGMGYVGAATIQELREKGDFDRISGEGLRESHPHGVEVLPESSDPRRRS